MKAIGLVIVTSSMLQMSCGYKDQKATRLASNNLSSEQSATRELDSEQPQSVSKESQLSLANFVGTWSGKLVDHRICLNDANSEVVPGTEDGNILQLKISQSLNKLTVTQTFTKPDGSDVLEHTYAYEISPDGQVTFNEKKSGRLFTNTESLKLAIDASNTNQSDTVGTNGWITSYSVPNGTPGDLIFHEFGTSVFFSEAARGNCTANINGVLSKSP